MSKLELGLEEALKALKEAAENDRSGNRLSASALNLVVDIAWKHQFDSESRSNARRQLAQVLSKEVQAVEQRAKS